jgi:hypothetical protein
VTVPEVIGVFVVVTVEVWSAGMVPIALFAPLAFVVVPLVSVV